MYADIFIILDAFVNFCEDTIFEVESAIWLGNASRMGATVCMAPPTCVMIDSSSCILLFLELVHFRQRGGQTVNNRKLMHLQPPPLFNQWNHLDTCSLLTGDPCQLLQIKRDLILPYFRFNEDNTLKSHFSVVKGDMGSLSHGVFLLSLWILMKDILI